MNSKNTANSASIMNGTEGRPAWGRMQYIQAEFHATRKEIAKKEREDAIELLMETRKFLNRLPSEWYPETITAHIDEFFDSLSKDKENINE